jgi:hypothetical protein
MCPASFLFAGAKAYLAHQRGVKLASSSCETDHLAMDFHARIGRDLLSKRRCVVEISWKLPAEIAYILAAILKHPMTD